MKIVCDACQAKYSISDDKVQGKVFKIRCKKCSNIIVVRGGATASEAPAPQEQKDTRVYDYGHEGGGDGGGDESVWHVVINQDQVGPMTAAEVGQRFAAGEIDGETYAWREGFADWLPLSQIDNFASLAAGGGGGGGAAAVSNMFGGGGGGNDESGTVRSDPGDLFAAASSAASRQHDDDGDNDLFGGGKSGGTGGGGGGGADKLRGERNENSVLFSLNNLAQLASDKPAHNPGVTSTPSGHATGSAGGEGSGLIDIRSMANAYLGGAGGGAAAKTSTASAGIGSIDDLPVFGGGGFSEPAVIVPTAQRQTNNKMMMILIGSVGVLAVAAVVLVVVMLKKPSAPAAAVANTNGAVATNDKGSSEAKGEEPKDTEKKTDEKKTDEKAETPGKTDEKATETPGKTDEKATETPGKTDEPKTTEKTTPEKKTPKVAEKTVPKNPQVAAKEPKTTEKAAPKETTPPPAKDTGGCDEVSCVLNNYEGACCAKFKKKGSGTATPVKTSGGGDLPDALDRAMISDGVNKVKAKVMACGDKSSAKGQVKVSVKVKPDGSVDSVTVKNTPDAGLGSCVQSAMTKAHFSKTQSGGSFGYPFVF